MAPLEGTQRFHACTCEMSLGVVSLAPLAVWSSHDDDPEDFRIRCFERFLIAHEYPPDKEDGWPNG